MAVVNRVFVAISGRSLLPDALIEQGAKRLIVLEGSPLFTDVWKVGRLTCDQLINPQSSLTSLF